MRNLAFGQERAGGTATPSRIGGSRACAKRADRTASGEPENGALRDGAPLHSNRLSPLVRGEVAFGRRQVVGVVEEAQDAAALARGDDAHGGVGGAEEQFVARADDVPDIGVDHTAVTDNGDALAGVA